MKFVDDYNYKHIPFCGTCDKHSGFSVNTTNTIRGAVSLDNPNGPDPTLIANKSITKLHCNTCGKIMSRFEDINRSFFSATDYEMQFYSDAELESKIESDQEARQGCSMVLIFTPFLCSGVFGFILSFFQGRAWEITYRANLWFLGLTFLWMVFGLMCKTESDEAKKCDAEKSKRKSRQSERLIIGTSPNNEQVAFNQKTGEITYE